MDKNHDYDPMAALAVRISTPDEQEFLRGNIGYIEADHGSAMAADLVRALSTQDVEAARRVASALCEDADFVLVSPESPARVEWVLGDVSGSTSMPRGTPAQAIVIAAVSARSAAAKRDAQLPRP